MEPHFQYTQAMQSAAALQAANQYQPDLQPQATVGVEASRAYEAACECSKMVVEIANRILGPAPVAGAINAMQQDDSLRGQVRRAADTSTETAVTLRRILQAL